MFWLSTSFSRSHSLNFVYSQLLEIDESFATLNKAYDLCYIVVIAMECWSVSFTAGVSVLWPNWVVNKSQANSTPHTRELDSHSWTCRPDRHFLWQISSGPRFEWWRCVVGINYACIVNVVVANFLRAVDPILYSKVARARDFFFFFSCVWIANSCALR